MRKVPAVNAAMLFLASLIWGTAFVAQSMGMDYMGPMTFNGLRYFLGAAVLLPLIVIRRLRGEGGDLRMAALGGLCCGTALFAASTMQQIGIVTTDVGKAGFMTALYIVLVPLINFFITRKTSLRLWVGVALASVGLYYLSVSGEMHLEPGDRSLLLCALLFSLQIMAVDHFAPHTDSIELAFAQFVTAGTLGTLTALKVEEVHLSAVAAGILPLLYVGIFSSGIAYTLQIAGQKGADPSIASLIMSLESVISAVAGFLILHQVLSRREIFGCVLMFAAIILVQLPVGAQEEAVRDIGESCPAE